MNLPNAILVGFGLSTLLLGNMPSVQAQARLIVPKPPSSSTSRVSSSLGGPITPSQPNFFENVSTPLTPPPLSLENDNANQILRTTSDAPVVPMVGDPPRTSRGGIINIKTD